MSCPFETREQKIFLELLVIILNEVANNSRAVRQSFWREILLCIDTPQHFAVNQKHALQNAVLPHQIFRRPNLGFFFLILLFLGAAQQLTARQHGSRKNNSTPEENSAVK